MYKENTENGQKLRKLLDCVGRLSRGDMLRYEEMESVTGIYRLTPKWGWLVYRLKRELERERGISLMAEYGVGYRLCTEDEQLKVYPRKKQKESVRRLKDGMRAVEALDIAEMSLAKKQYRALILSNMVDEVGAIKKHMRQQDSFLRKSETVLGPN